MKARFAFLLFAFAGLGGLHAATAPLYLGAAPHALARAKARLADGDAALRPALDKLVADADRALKVEPLSVTHKTKLAPSGDRHDYMSTGPYWWPDPSTPDGLPYLRRDGVVNPESRTAASDQVRSSALGSAVGSLALAHHFTGRDAYAAHAARLLRFWFLDPATRMNPNMEFAQGIPGSVPGRPAGLIEAGGVVDAADASALLSGSPHWSAEDEAALRDWCGRFLDWMLESDLGRREGAARNNHGTLYDVRVVKLALKAGREDLARRIVEEAKERRIAAQIEPDGRQPHELGRTKSFSYSRLNLNGLAELAVLGGFVGVDLWGFETADGRSIRRAVEFLLPYALDPKKPWPHDQITEFDPAELAGLLRRAGVGCGEPRYEAVVAAMDGTARSRLQLTHPAQP